MKAIICFDNGDIHLNSFTTDWTPCACGNVRVKWLDPARGTVVVAAIKPWKVRLLGLNNHYLIPTVTGENLPWLQYQALHDKATDAPGYLFNKDKINCWAAVVEIGRSNDVRWATDEEYQEAFGLKKDGVTDGCVIESS